MSRFRRLLSDLLLLSPCGALVLIFAVGDQAANNPTLQHPWYQDVLVAAVCVGPFSILLFLVGLRLRPREGPSLLK